MATVEVLLQLLRPAVEEEDEVMNVEKERSLPHPAPAAGRWFTFGFLFEKRKTKSSFLVVESFFKKNKKRVLIRCFLIGVFLCFDFCLDLWPSL